MPLKVLIGGVNYSQYYIAKSLKVQERAGSDRSSFNFSVGNPPVPPREEQPVVFWDSDLDRRKECAGRIRRVRRKVVGKVDGVAKFVYEIEVKTWAADLEVMAPLTAEYLNKTTGFIARDALAPATDFDMSNVTSGGTVQDGFTVRHLEINKVLDQLAAIEGWKWWVDYDHKVYYGDPFTLPLAFTIDDSNWDTICGDSLEIEPDTSNLANQIRLFYEGKYTDGLVNVFNTGRDITGIGTLWAEKVTPNAKFRLKDTYDISYGIQNVVDDDTITLSSAYAEATLSNQAYVIEGLQMGMQRQDAVSVAAIAALAGDSGIRHKNVDYKGAYLTFTEASAYLDGLLKEHSNPTVNISFKTTNRQLGVIPLAGQPVAFVLTDWGINTILQITQITKDDIGAYDEDGYPVYQISIKFETKLYDLASTLRKKEKAEQTAPRESNLLDEIFTAAELVVVTENVSGIITPMITAEDVIATDDSNTITTIEQHWAPYVWGPSTKAWDVAGDWNAGTHNGTKLDGSNNLILNAMASTGSPTWASYGGQNALNIAAGKTLTIPTPHVVDFSKSGAVGTLLLEDGYSLLTESGNTLGVEDWLAGAFSLRFYISATQKSGGGPFFLASVGGSGQGSDDNSLRLYVGTDGLLRLRVQGTTGDQSITTAVSGLADGYHWAGWVYNADVLELWVDGVKIGTISSPPQLATMPANVYLLSDASGANQWGPAVLRFFALRGIIDNSTMAGQQTAGGTMPSWVTGTTVAQGEFSGGTLNLANEGIWTSPMYPLLCGNLNKTATITATTPSNSVVSPTWLSHMVPGDRFPIAATLPLTPNGQFFSFQLTLKASTAGATPTVDRVELDPWKSVLAWNRSTWGETVWAADFSNWSLARTDNTTTPGELLLATGYNEGYAVSPWNHLYTRPQSPEVVTVYTAPGVSTVKVYHRTSPDGSDLSASSWEENLGYCPEDTYTQTMVVFTGTDTDRPSVQSLTRTPH